MRLIEDGPGIARGADGKPLISPELYLVVDGIKRSTKTKANLPLRGIGEQGTALRKGITITAGRMFDRGSNEVVVGKALLREFEGFDIGSTVAFGATRWKIFVLVTIPNAAMTTRRTARGASIQLRRPAPASRSLAMLPIPLKTSSEKSTTVSAYVGWPRKMVSR